MNKVYITAIVPVYNVQDYLEECVDSICNQTEPFDEVILVNDGSTDNSQKICEKYCEEYDYISLINQENAGLSEARNIGLKTAKGQYVMYIDSDDCIDLNTVKRLKKEIVKTIYDAVFFSASIKSDLGIAEAASYYVRDNVLCGMDMTGVEFFSKAFPSNYIVSACLAIYKRSFLLDNEIFFEKGLYFEDNDFHLRVCMMAHTVKCLHEAYYIRRYRANSIMSGGISYKKCADMIKVNQLLWKVMEQASVNTNKKISFITDYLIHTWNMISESEYLDDVRKEWKSLVKTFYDKWWNIYWENSIAFYDKLILYLMMKEIETTGTARSELETELEKELIGKLETIPLSATNKKIGIYGIGKHTEKMFELYRKYIGDIKTNIVFIITENMQETKTYQGCPLITCGEISEDIDYILISSLKFQKDMLGILNKNNVDKERIITLYKEDEYCDLTAVMKILSSE